jgi:hypothetical protein
VHEAEKASVYTIFEFLHWNFLLNNYSFAGDWNCADENTTSCLDDDIKKRREWFFGVTSDENFVLHP